MGMDSPQRGVLLINLGTPDAPETGPVRRYLRQFLSDPRVIDIPALPRWLLLNLAILPFRPRQSAAAYRKIWTQDGSPLFVESRALASAVARSLGDGWQVELGMRYGSPSIDQAMQRLIDAGVNQIQVLPLFPQYASSSFGSAVEAVYQAASQRWNTPTLQILPPFYDHPGFIGALASVAAPVIDGFQPDHILMSYHGLPERQILKSDTGASHCFTSDDCCDRFVQRSPHCYRGQCFATSYRLAESLGLNRDRFSVSFQSRLGRTPWIKPYTDLVFPELAARGIRKLAVICPSFVADCLETLEEIGIRGREQWREAGGTELELIPCVNHEASWVDAVVRMIQKPASDG